MYWFKCDNIGCGKLSRSKSASIVCVCGMVLLNCEKLVEYEFSGEDRVLDIPVNPVGKLYKMNKKCMEEFRRMVDNNGKY